MSLSKIISGGVTIADKVTKSVQATVTHKAWIGQDGMGVMLYAGGVERRAVVDMKRRPMFTLTGEMVLTKATLTFVGPVPPTKANAGQNRQNPIDPRDIFILPDGTTGPVISTDGLINPDTNAPFINEVVLGS